MITTPPYFELRLKLQKKFDYKGKRRKGLTAKHAPLRRHRSDYVG
jgi:hypothetical protein